MWQALTCLPEQHDLSYVLAATLVCVLGSLLSMRLLARVRRNTGMRRLHLLFLAGLVAGGTVWTTHFSAMLGYNAPVARAFEPGLSFASLMIAVVFAWVGFFVTARTRLGPAIEVGGAIFGLGIAAMHYTGMAAFEIPGVLGWNYPLVALSVVFAAGFGVVAANRIARPVTRFCKYGGTLAMILAIVSLHFTGMAAVTIYPVFDIAVPPQTLSDTFMITSVIVGVSLIMAMGASAYAIDLQAANEATESYKHQALHDPLTGLPNRNGLAQQLHDLLAGRVDDTARVVVLAIDLDRFKDINDVHGHVGGDHLLRQVARRISAELQEGEFLARIGGDEFVAVKSEIFARGEAMKFAERLRKVVLEPVEWQHQTLAVGCSIGVALFPEHGQTSESLTQRADLAMYRAKSLGRGKICTYEPSMDEASRARAELAIDLKRALIRDELELYYQVQNDTQTGEIVGFEALIRWNHPQKGRIPPDAFIPIAEETGLIIEIGDWVMRTACLAAARWRMPYKVAVNVAPMQLNHDLPRRVAEILKETGLPPARLEIELTESGIIADRQHALQVVLALKKIGVTVAMDDFGTGYSSLSTLQAFPFDKIKVDKSFVQAVETSVHAAAIVKATLLLGRSLNIPVLAEGVETTRHLDFLREEGCDSVQGYLFGKPMPLDVINRMIDDQTCVEPAREAQDDRAKGVAA
ncbi:EAL domain-containing protein [Bradyrhizobium diazoefficiens]|jgi:diguanylate cyclase (GGDEF)-like protein|nr:bifunctional diguanylate cyclase/phosphodiesterase [Bradyrhizobium diazoefficiens]UCF52562.1 MAG: EAL domain-containing protein [Bradyrhizobium sp.]MBR0966136.1 EAL domain-containing protein [Bradyrhizobium diazoefficiens]MBR0979606.1 EAL domain-containing protein [Bradyrhizobium diazoefficiens]MBR1008954.1 EAL domain-containing protein [Bradyrhizobium diazoefficiens]MBR1015402.1 EAL domain-containing protein [Bradyrhizobium diazoefficiens]